MTTTLPDYREVAEQLLQGGHMRIRQQIQDKIGPLVNSLIDIRRSERILHFAQQIHGETQQNLGMEDRIILSLTGGTTEVIFPGLIFGLDGVKNGENKTIPVRNELSGMVDSFTKTLYADPKAIINKSSGTYTKRLGLYYKKIASPQERLLLSRKTKRRFFEYSSRNPLDGKVERDGFMNGEGGPFFANLLESIFPEYIVNILDEGNYYVIFTDYEIFIETPSKETLRIKTNEEYRKVFSIRETSGNSPERKELIGQVNAEISDYIKSLTGIKHIPASPTDITFNPKGRETPQGIWFTQTYDCPNINDEYVILILERILKFFGKSVQKYFPQTISNIPGEFFGKIQIFSVPGSITGASRIRKAVQDLDYFEQVFLKGNECWDYPFLNGLIEDIYAKRGEKGSDQGLVYNILGSIYRHILVDLEKKDGKNIMKWEESYNKWMQLMKGEEKFKSGIEKLKSTGLYKKGISEKMLGLGYFIHYGYIAYALYSPPRYESITINQTKEIVQNPQVSPDILHFFHSLLGVQKKNTPNV